MALLLKLKHHPPPLLLLLLVAVGATLASVPRSSSPISDLKSKISGVEDLLEEFSKQLQQQDQAYRTAAASDLHVDSCVGDFDAAGESIIRAKASVEQGAAFLLAPERVYSWRDCLHACCAQSHCTVALVQEEDVRRPRDSLNCYLFNCTYRGRNVCSFAPQQGFTTYSRTNNTTTLGPGHHHLLPGSAASTASGGAGRRPGEGLLAEEGEAQGEEQEGWG